ncbi:hypothetical protein LA080_011080 [Diaporthe eres]|nr:hypothetical protein LA080_011080 [Diaporthe eres]
MLIKNGNGLDICSAEIGFVETIVHTAGVGPSVGSARRVYEIDLLGTVNVIDAFLLVVQAGSSLVCISSMAELLNHPGLRINDLEEAQGAATAYGISKRANLVRVQASAVAWGLKGARINSVSPGVISTELGRKEIEGPAGKYVKASPAGRAGAPQEIVNAVAFLVKPASCFITGNDLLVDGGVTSSIKWRSRDAPMKSTDN